MYTYHALVIDVYDGDTITVDIDLGLGVWLRGQKIRLYGINAPEMRGPEKVEGRKAKQWLAARILGQRVTLRTYKDKKGKYGRWLAVVFTDEGVDLNAASVELGYAKAVDYGS